MDVVLAGVVLLILSPLFLIIMIVLRCSGEGEVFLQTNSDRVYEKAIWSIQICHHGEG